MTTRRAIKNEYERAARNASRRRSIDNYFDGVNNNNNKSIQQQQQQTQSMSSQRPHMSHDNGYVSMPDSTKQSNKEKEHSDLYGQLERDNKRTKASSSTSLNAQRQRERERTEEYSRSYRNDREKSNSKHASTKETVPYFSDPVREAERLRRKRMSQLRSISTERQRRRSPSPFAYRRGHISCACMHHRSRTRSRSRTRFYSRARSHSRSRSRSPFHKHVSEVQTRPQIIPVPVPAADYPFALEVFARNAILPPRLPYPMPPYGLPSAPPPLHMPPFLRNFSYRRGFAAPFAHQIPHPFPGRALSRGFRRPNAFL